MSFHQDKCSILRIIKKKTPVNHDYILHIFRILQTDTATKYLDIAIPSDLKWNTDVDKITSNVNQQLNYLKRNLNVSSKQIKKGYTCL
jgi:hypothetical protein